MDQLVDPCLKALPVETVQTPVIADVLAGRQARIEPAAVGQDPDPFLHVATVLHRVHAVDPDPSAVGLKHRVDDTESRRLAGTIGSNKPCHLAVAG